VAKILFIEANDAQRSQFSQRLVEAHWPGGDRIVLPDADLSALCADAAYDLLVLDVAIAPEAMTALLVQGQALAIPIFIKAPPAQEAQALTWLAQGGQDCLIDTGPLFLQRLAHRVSTLVEGKVGWRASDLQLPPPPDDGLD